jgi:hypothetical protein
MFRDDTLETAVSPPEVEARLTKGGSMDIKDLNPDIIERAKACKSSEELVALATEQG